MEFFIPGLLLFLLAIGLSFALVPKATPLITAVLSIVFLTFGVYQHYKMFASEYRLSTWQSALKIYAPAVMIIGIIIFIIYGILAFFTRGSVPVPPIPIPENISNATNTITESLNKVANVLTNTTSNLLNQNHNMSINLNKNKAPNEKGPNQKASNENNLSRSFLEIV